MRANAKQLKEIVRRIIEVAHPLRIILFGPAARGEMTKDSDIDLMVVMPPGTHRRHVAQDLFEQVGGVGRDLWILWWPHRRIWKGIRTR